jgi:hypothetical protein
LSIKLKSKAGWSRVRTSEGQMCNFQNRFDGYPLFDNNMILNVLI